MTETTTFRLGDVLSFTDGALLSRDHMSGVQRLADFMVGDSVFTHQLPAVVDPIKESILAQHPVLAEIVFPSADMPDEGREEFIEGWLSGREQTFGDEWPLTPIGAGAPDVSTPFADAVELMGVENADRVIAVEI